METIDLIIYFTTGMFTAWLAKGATDNNKLFIWGWFLGWPILLPVGFIYLMIKSLKYILFE